MILFKTAEAAAASPRKRDMGSPGAAAATSFSLGSLSDLCLAATLLLHHASAQTSQPSPTTDPTEAKALNSIFRSWNISSNMSRAKWNTTGDPCSGSAVDISGYKDDMNRFNPFILCDCSSNNGSTCHITRLNAYKLNIVGTIPDELKHLSKLDNLKIDDNYLSGPLPAFIGNFSAMKYLAIGRNVLSGVIPKELGNLQNLISLGLGMNNFSGPIPPELGNLTSLEQIYMGSIGVSGEIPSTFAKLQKLKFMTAYDNNLGGKVPDLLGNLTKLVKLQLQGNSFQGPIPSTLANLQSLVYLHLGDLLNGTSSLAFIGHMTLLSTLILRDAKISDNIPSNIGQFRKMEHLDLSFNNLTGTLPPSLFNMESLEHLYLGNNSISGHIPEKKSGSLLNIDLSYNELSGSIPPWASEEDLQLNLVANNFAISDSNNVPSKGLACLQRDFPCYQGHPIYYSFAINCGGVAIRSSDGTEYEADDHTLTTASYYVTNAKRWAVSSTGRFVDSQNPKYKENSLSNFLNTSDAKLFQSARLSPSSLRYYGLSMENGPYTVNLQFAEIAFPDDHSLEKNIGRRVFDIYIQGNLVVRDFDIKKEAGGIPFKAISREYNATVMNNYLEIHFFWAGKGTCCLPRNGYYGPLISAISVTANFKPTVSNQPPNNISERKKIALIVGTTVGGVVLLSICIFGAGIWRQKKQPNVGESEELQGLDAVPDSFSYVELQSATKNFSPENKLGEGGFGAVFKGILKNGTMVAIKQLSIMSLQGKSQFVSEVASLSEVKHRNLVKLYGCCFEENRRLLVYEYLENSSLDRVLFGKSELQLDWQTRFAVCLGMAKGIAYLHEESNVRIIHRDIKTSNVLLDNDLNAKISDFGLAKLYDDQLTHITTRVAGTIGYLAPEYAMRGHLTEKVDIFSFGVVVLELLCGRSNNDTSLDAEKVYLIEWAWSLHEKGRGLEMLDPTLTFFNKEEASRMIAVAFLCIQANPLLRPPMSSVVAMLVGDLGIIDMASKPAYLSDWQFDDLLGQATATTFGTSIEVSSDRSSSPTTLLSS